MSPGCEIFVWGLGFKGSNRLRRKVGSPSSHAIAAMEKGTMEKVHVSFAILVHRLSNGSLEIR